MTFETLVFLNQILSAQTLNVGAPDFDEAAHMVLNARQELAEAIAAAQLKAGEE